MNTRSVVRTTVRPPLHFGSIQRSCSYLSSVLLPWTVSSTILARTSLPSFVATLVDGRAVFALDTRRGTTLLAMQALYLPSQEEILLVLTP